MMNKRRFVFIFGVALCLIASPAMANMFSFSYSGVQSNYTGDASGGTFTLVKVNSATDGRVFTDTENARFQANSWGLGGNFSITLDIFNVGAETASGTGGFTITDIDGDTITGTIEGQWQKQSLLGGMIEVRFFGGILPTVAFQDNPSADSLFTGHTGSVSLDPLATGHGAISIAPLLTSQWFDATWSAPVTTGSVDASVVPIPAGVLLGFLGLAAAGLGLRRLA